MHLTAASARLAGAFSATGSGVVPPRHARQVLGELLDLPHTFLNVLMCLFVYRAAEPNCA